jgi:methanogenic corrinoid protein MtbC1
MMCVNNNAQLVNTLLSGDKTGAVLFAQETIKNGIDPKIFFKDYLTPAMEHIGDMFSRLECFFPELILAADAAQAISNEVIQPLLRKQQQGQITKQGKIVIGTVKGDLHDIGKNIVSLMLEVNGFDVIDLGVNVDTQLFIDCAIDVKADIVALSALLTTSMPYMREVVERRDGLGYSDRFEIIVGGAIITKEYCGKIGANDYAENAIEGVQKCLMIMETRRSQESRSHLEEKL